MTTIDTSTIPEFVEHMELVAENKRLHTERLQLICDMQELLTVLIEFPGLSHLSQKARDQIGFLEEFK